MNWQSLPLALTAFFLGLPLVFAFLRLVIGPSVCDRVIALDLMSTVGIAAIGVYAVATGEAVFLDVATVLALVSFLAVVAFAHYVARRAREPKEPGEATSG